MRAKSFSLSLLISAACIILPLILYFPYATTAFDAGGRRRSQGPVPVSNGPTVRKNERWPLVSSEFGDISAVKISDGRESGSYLLHFITMEPNSLFLPIQLYSEMIFYVNSGTGTLSWTDVNEDNDKLRQVNLKSGDVYRLQPQTVFYIENKLVDDCPQELEIYAIFPDSEDDLLQHEQRAGVYAGVHNLVLGFDNVVLQSTLNVPEEIIEQLRTGEGQPLIIQGLLNNSTAGCSRVMGTFLGTKNNDVLDVENKKKDKHKKKDKNEKKAYNMRMAEHDVENSYGWSTTVTKKQLGVLKDSDFSVFMVNLTMGAMMGPHWNPRSAEIAIVLRGQGMVQVVCPSIANEAVCQNSRFRVAEGDVFVVPRYHPMAQISYDNESFVFMGFTMTSKDNFPQYLVGKLSILQTLDTSVLAKSFDVSPATMDQVLSCQKESIILDCTSCAEDEEWATEEGGQRKRERGRGGGGGGGGGGGWQEPERERARREWEREGRGSGGGRWQEAERGRGRAREGGGGGGSYGRGREVI